MSTYLYYGMIAIRLLVLLISVLGWLTYLRKEVRVEFALGILLTGIGSLMFAAGILHVMRETAWLVFLGGFWLLVREIGSFPEKKTGIRSVLTGICTPGMAVFGLLAVFFLVLLFESEFTHYDNFSHWGLVAQIISRKDMFPNPSDTTVTFTSYPLGSAAFIYFITEIVGTAPEWLQMWAQAILMAGIFISLFTFGSGAICSVTAAAGILMLMCANTAFVDLLVDTLLPVIAVGGMAFCIYYKKELEDKLWFVIPYVVFLTSVKNSGMLFSLLLLVYTVGVVPQTRENVKKLAFLGLSPVAALFLWNRHVEQLFDGGTVSKHAMRLDNFRQILEDKNSENLTAIVKVFWQTTVANRDLLIYLLLMTGLILLLRRAVLKKDCREPGRILLITTSFCAVYQLGILAMYILTMPLEEALMMAGYERYYATGVIFAGGMMLLALIRELDLCRTHLRGIVFAVILAALALVFTALTVNPQFDYYIRQNLEHTERAKIDRLISDYDLRPEDRYLILVSESRNDAGYLYWMASYLLEPEKIVITDVPSIQEEQMENDFSFVIMFENTEVNRDYLETQFGITEEVGYIAGKPLF